MYWGANRAQAGILVATFNYRVSRFGWFAHPQLARENADNGLEFARSRRPHNCPARHTVSDRGHTLDSGVRTGVVGLRLRYSLNSFCAKW